MKNAVKKTSAAPKQQNKIAEHPRKDSYEKSILLGLGQFASNRDLLRATLSDQREYTIKEVEQIIMQYMAKEVH